MAILAPSPTNPMIITMSPLSVSAMGAPLPICCNNCDDKELKCKAHPHTKGSCYHCIVNGLQCLFPPITFLGHASPGTTNVSLFQRNCVHCTQSHQRCVFDTDSPLQCKCCIKLQVTCFSNYHPKAAVMIWSHQLMPTIPTGDLPMWTRVFTIIIITMVIAATI